MPPAARVTDTTTHGGTITGPAPLACLWTAGRSVERPVRDCGG